MVKANELRIGNYVKNTHAQLNLKITEIRGELCIMGEHHCAYKTLVGIPLTPEIIEKCGFKEEGLQCDYTLGEVDFHRMDNGYSFGPYGYIMTNKIHSLHQLQNLYFALTGEELTINL